MAPRLYQLSGLRDAVLMIWDCGFHDFDRVVAVRRRGAHVLSRLPAGVKPQVLRTLPDGWSLAYLLPSQEGRRRGERILVRVITYTISDPALPGYGEQHRIIAKSKVVDLVRS